LHFGQRQLPVEEIALSSITLLLNLLMLKNKRKTAHTAIVALRGGNSGKKKFAIHIYTGTSVKNSILPQRFSQVSLTPLIDKAMVTKNKIPLRIKPTENTGCVKKDLTMKSIGGLVKNPRIIF
jgi:hypothetical protein